MDISGLDANLFAAYGSAGGHGHDHAGGLYDHAHDAGNSMVGEDSLCAYIDHDRVTCLNEATAGHEGDRLPPSMSTAHPLDGQLPDVPARKS